MNPGALDRKIAAVGLSTAVGLAAIADVVPSALCYPLGSVGGLLCGYLLVSGDGAL